MTKCADELERISDNALASMKVCLGPKPDDDVIEGKVVSLPRRELSA